MKGDILSKSRIWLRASGSVAFMALTILGVSACAANGGSDENSDPQTCAEFLALSDDQRASVYSDALRVQTYSATGAESLAEDDLYARECPNAEGSTALSDFSYGDPTYADCELFKTLSPDIQLQWLDAVYKEQYYELGRPVEVGEIVAACDAFVAGNLVAASNYIDSYGSFMAWDTETNLGYREKLAVGVLPLISGEGVVHPDEQEFVAGSACGFDPAKDAAIPLKLFIQNSTEGQAQALAARFTLGVTGNTSDLTTTAYLEANYSSGADCSEPANSFSGAVISTLFQELSDAGTSVQSVYFVIVKDYFSPRYPEGAVGELASYVLQSGAQVSQDDPVINASTASISLDVSAR